MINLSELHSYVVDSQSNICQMIVIQNGKTIVNDTWNGYKADDTVHTMSVTKSIVSLLVGIALERGLIGSIDDFVLDYFPDYKIKRMSGHRVAVDFRDVGLQTDFDSKTNGKTVMAGVLKTADFFYIGIKIQKK